MNGYDYYAVAFEIARILREEGKSDWAAKLENAIQFGATGTEILMALRWHLQQFKAEGQTCTCETESLMDELLQELNKPLQ